MCRRRAVSKTNVLCDIPSNTKPALLACIATKPLPWRTTIVLYVLLTCLGFVVARQTYRNMCNRKLLFVQYLFLMTSPVYM